MTGIGIGIVSPMIGTTKGEGIFVAQETNALRIKHKETHRETVETVKQEVFSKTRTFQQEA